MRLLQISENSRNRFENHFEEVERVELEDVTPEVINQRADVKVSGERIREYDACLCEIPQKNAPFGRTLLEIIEESGIPLNCHSTSYFVSSKKNYLYYTLKSREIPAPKTAVIPSEKSCRNVEKHLKGPLLARKFEGFQEVERHRLETVEEIEEFSEGLKHPESMAILHQLRNSENYRCLYIDGDIISLKDKDSEGLEMKEENLVYSSAPSKLQETVKNACRSIGLDVAEVEVRSGMVYDVKPICDYELFTSLSGKNAYQKTAEMLKNRSEK